MPKKTIAIDIDDVIAAESASIIKFSNNRWGHNLTIDDYDENWQEMWGVEYDELLRRAEILHRPGVQTSYELIDGVHEALHKLAGSYNVVALTSRRSSVKDETVEWLEKVFKGVFSDFYFTGFWDDTKPGGHLLTKGELARDLKVDYLIDDQPKHCLSAAEHGVKTVLFGDYKIGRDLKLPAGVVRARNWQEVLEYFDGEK